MEIAFIFNLCVNTPHKEKAKMNPPNRSKKTQIPNQNKATNQPKKKLPYIFILLNSEVLKISKGCVYEVEKRK